MKSENEIVVGIRRKRRNGRREVAAMMILQGLMANPERYKYIAEHMRPGYGFKGMTQEEATAKNVNKAVVMATALIDELERVEAQEKEESQC